MGYSVSSIVLIVNVERKLIMFKTNAELRRFLMFQKRSCPDCPPKLWDEYSIYVHCVGFDEYPKTIKQWLGD